MSKYSQLYLCQFGDWHRASLVTGTEPVLEVDPSLNLPQV